MRVGFESFENRFISDIKFNRAPIIICLLDIWELSKWIKFSRRNSKYPWVFSRLSNTFKYHIDLQLLITPKTTRDFEQFYSLKMKIIEYK